MNVDLYCTHCSHIIEIICTNLEEYQHSIHKSEYESVSCDRCNSAEYVVVRCYILRDTVTYQMKANVQENEHKVISRVG